MKKAVIFLVIVFLESSVMTMNPVDRRLFSAVAAESVEGVKAALAAGANVNAVDNDGLTALMRVGAEGYAEIVRMLIAAGADVNAVTSSGWTALMRAVFNGKAERARILIDAGANVNAVNNDGLTVLIIAVINDEAEIVRMLIAAGADVNAVTSSGMTVLDLAEQRSFFNIALMLLPSKINKLRQAIALSEEQSNIKEKIQLQTQLDVARERFERNLKEQGKKDLVNSELFMQGQIIVPETKKVVPSLKVMALKKMYENYYLGYPDALLDIVGNKNKFSLFKETFFKPEFLNQLYQEYEQREKAKDFKNVAQVRKPEQLNNNSPKTYTSKRVGTVKHKCSMM